MPLRALAPHEQLVVGEVVRGTLWVLAVLDWSLSHHLVLNLVVSFLVLGGSTAISAALYQHIWQPRPSPAHRPSPVPLAPPSEDIL